MCIRLAKEVKISPSSPRARQVVALTGTCVCYKSLMEAGK